MFLSSCRSLPEAGVAEEVERHKSLSYGARVNAPRLSSYT
jgi:hypothetical protein